MLKTFWAWCLCVSAVHHAKQLLEHFKQTASAFTAQKSCSFHIITCFVWFLIPRNKSCFRTVKMPKAERAFASNAQLLVKRPDCRRGVKLNSDHICKCSLRSTAEQHISVAGPPQIKLITPGPERITAAPDRAADEEMWWNVRFQHSQCDSIKTKTAPSVAAVTERSSPSEAPFGNVGIRLDVRIMEPSGETRGSDGTGSLSTKLQENIQPTAPNCLNTWRYHREDKDCEP